MSDLIDRAALREVFNDHINGSRTGSDRNSTWRDARSYLNAAPTIECAACAAHENCSIESEMLYIVKYPERLNGAMCCALFQRRQP